MDEEMGLRFADGSDDVLEGWLVPWGGSFNGRDSYGTYATPDTDFCLDWFPSGRPLLYNHGIDDAVRTEVVGRISDLEKRDRGLWMKAQLDKRSSWYAEVKDLVKQKVVGLSSGAMGHLVDIEPQTGEWKRWPLVEGSVTPTESNLLATIESHTLASAIRSAGFEPVANAIDAEAEHDPQILHPEALEGMRAKLTSKARDNLDDSDFAYIDSKGGKHLPIHDAEHVRNAIARFSQTEFENDAAKAKAKQKILAAAKKFNVDVSDDSMRSADGHPTLCLCEDCQGGPAPLFRFSPVRANVAADAIDYERSFEDIRDDIMDLLNPSGPYSYGAYSSVIATFPDFVVICRADDDGDCSYWRISYTLNDQDEPVLGDSQQVEQVFIPTAQRSAITPLTIDAGALIRDAASITERTKDLSDRRIREGRVISRGNRRILSDAHDAMGKAHQALGDLLTSTDMAEQQAARAADPLWWSWQQAELEALAHI